MARPLIANYAIHELWITPSQPWVAIKRAAKLYRQRSAAGFVVVKPQREGSRLNAHKLEEARA